GIDAQDAQQQNRQNDDSGAAEDRRPLASSAPQRAYEQRRTNRKHHHEQGEAAADDCRERVEAGAQVVRVEVREEARVEGVGLQVIRNALAKHQEQPNQVRKQRQGNRREAQQSPTCNQSQQP